MIIRYLDSELKSTLSADPDFRFCIEPKCSSGQLHEGDGYIFKCVQCGHKSCIKCNVAWHEDETCDMFNVRVKTGRAKVDDTQERLGLEHTELAKKREAGTAEAQRLAAAVIETARREKLKREAEEAAAAEKTRKEAEETQAALLLKQVSKLCPGCKRKIQKDG